MVHLLCKKMIRVKSVARYLLGSPDIRPLVSQSICVLELFIHVKTNDLLGFPPGHDMLCNVYFVPVYAAGISGTKEHEEDFRFCGHRMQKRKSSIHYEMQKDTLMSILIVNSWDGLNITAPFPPEPKGANPSGPVTFPLQDSFGNYRFCLYWIQNTQLFVFQYGSKNYTLSKRANYSLCSPNISKENTNYTGTPVLYNVSYASKKVSSNTSLPNLLGYNFIIKGIILNYDS